MCGKWCVRAAPAALAHLNLLLTLYGGAALASAARLKWDPSTYVVLRELFPAEYRAAAAGLVAGGVTLLLLAHLAAAALHAHSLRIRVALLYLYAALMGLLMAAELVFGTWLALQVAEWLSSESAQQMSEALELGDHLRPLLRYLSRWHPLPNRLEAILQEAQEDAPRNAYAALALAALLALLQLLVTLLALVATRAPSAMRARSDSEMPLRPRPPPYSSGWGRGWMRRRAACCLTTRSAAGSGYQYQRMPRTAYRGGRIVVVEPRPA